MGESITQLECDACGITFDKVTKEVKRSVRLGRKQYCSRSCSSKQCHEHLKKFHSKKGQIKHITPGGTKDEYSIFRVHLRRAKKRAQECSITLEDLKAVYESQQGMCVYSKVKLTEVATTGYNDPITTASLDRIDSDKGYVVGNVQFISIAMNHMKNSMTHEQTLELLKIIKQS